MHGTRKTASRRQSQLFLGVLILGVILLASALWQPVSGEPPGWVAVNEQVKQVLTEQEREKELLAAAPGKKDETIVQETIKEASSEKPAEGAEKTSGELSDKATLSWSSANGELSEKASSGGAGGAGAGGAGAGGAGKLAEKSSAAGDSAGKMPAGDSSKLDINQATAEQFDALPGIGAVKAQTIVTDREKNGDFRSVDDLLRVKGIGPKLLEKMKASIVAGP